MCNAVTPAFGLVEAAIVAHAREPGERSIEQMRASLRRQVRFDAIRTRDLGKDQRRERSLEARSLGRHETRFEIRVECEHRASVERLAAQPGVIGLEGDLVAQVRVGVGQTRRQCYGERVALRVIGNLELVGFERREPGMIVARGWTGALCMRHGTRCKHKHEK